MPPTPDCTLGVIPTPRLRGGKWKGQGETRPLQSSNCSLCSWVPCPGQSGQEVPRPPLKYPPRSARTQTRSHSRAHTLTHTHHHTYPSGSHTSSLWITHTPLTHTGAHTCILTHPPALHTCSHTHGAGHQGAATSPALSTKSSHPGFTPAAGASSQGQGRASPRNTSIPPPR